MSYTILPLFIYPALPMLTFALLAALTMVLTLVLIFTYAPGKTSRRLLHSSVLSYILLVAASFVAPDCHSWNKNTVTMTSQNNKQQAVKCNQSRVKKPVLATPAKAFGFTASHSKLTPKERKELESMSLPSTYEMYVH